MEICPALCAAMHINFEVAGKKEETGDVVVTADEVNAVIKAL